MDKVTRCNVLAMSAGGLFGRWCFVCPCCTLQWSTMTYFSRVFLHVSVLRTCHPFPMLPFVFLDARPTTVHNENNSTCSLTRILQVAGFCFVECVMLTYCSVLYTTALITRPVNIGNIVSRRAYLTVRPSGPALVALTCHHHYVLL